QRPRAALERHLGQRLRRVPHSGQRREVRLRRLLAADAARALMPAGVLHRHPRRRQRRAAGAAAADRPAEGGRRMRTFLAPVVWLVALGIALVVLWRMRRGKRVVLRGKWGPRVIRTVAVLLVIFGAGGEDRTVPRAEAAPNKVLPETGEGLPQVVNEQSVYH